MVFRQLAATIHSFIFLNFSLFKHILQSGNYKRNWGMRMEVWLWCRCECWVLMNGSSEQITHQCYGNTTMGIWTTNRECFILILSRSPLWSDCWTTIGHFLSGESGALSCVPAVLQVLGPGNRNSEMRQRRHLKSKAMGQIWSWTEECLWVRVACRRKLPS